MTAPDWLKQREGTIKPGLTSHTLFVLISEKPLYRLDLRPVGGQFACTITQTVNGRRTEDEKKHTTESAALAGGFETLRAQLGW